jgi:hypothetical protein
VTPNNGNHDATTPVIISGLNLLGSTGVTAPSGITVAISNVSSDGQTMTASISVAVGTAAGGKTLTITTPTGNVNFSFTVN